MLTSLGVLLYLKNHQTFLYQLLSFQQVPTEATLCKWAMLRIASLYRELNTVICLATLKLYGQVTKPSKPTKTWKSPWHLQVSTRQALPSNQIANGCKINWTTPHLRFVVRWSRWRRAPIATCAQETTISQTVARKGELLWKSNPPFLDIFLHNFPV